MQEDWQTNTYNFQEQKNAALVFIDGSYILGYGVGKKGVSKGEICFNTSITGYQEIITDPSYSGQIINFTFPHIGNVGMNDNDLESTSRTAEGIIIRNKITSASNYRSEIDFNEWLRKRNITGISSIDTRMVTKIIKKNGAGNVAIIFDDSIDEELINKTAKELQKTPDLSGVELAKEASLNKNYKWGEQGAWKQVKNSYQGKKSNKLKVVAVDYGAKLNILRCLTQVGFDVEVVGAGASFKEIMSLKPDGIFLSNGPGDPVETFKYAGPVIKEIIEKKIPLFGICLGHQLLSLSVGAKATKMKQGHRGANHPVQNLETSKVEITSQNHGFCVDKSSVPDNVKITHISLFDKTVEGIELKDAPAFSVQHHPESSPGPNDSFYLFEKFVKLIKENAAN